MVSSTCPYCTRGESRPQEAKPAHTRAVHSRRPSVVPSPPLLVIMFTLKQRHLLLLGPPRYVYQQREPMTLLMW